MNNQLQIIPAIDIKGGRCVRLQQGRADAETVYGEDPLEMARRWQDEGAQRLHVVDLDGAFDGRPVNAETIAEIARTLDIPVQTGGGLRDEDDVNPLLDAGVDRVIFGTRACMDPDVIEDFIESFGDRIAVGIDARDGWVQVKGWTETTNLLAMHLAQQLDAAGLRTIIYTDTARDGMLGGVNSEALGKICGAVTCDVIASGGVSSLEDIRALKALQIENLSGAIVGKALYDGAVSLKDLMMEAG